jgi:hypothetical protein
MSLIDILEVAAVALFAMGGGLLSFSWAARRIEQRNRLNH